MIVSFAQQTFFLTSSMSERNSEKKKKTTKIKMASFVRAHKFGFVIFVLVYSVLAEFGINIFTAFELSNVYVEMSNGYVV